MRRNLSFDPDTTPSERGHLRAIRDLLPYLWPVGRSDLRTRVVISIILLIGAKVTIVFVPFLYGGAVDRLTSGADKLLVLPIGLILAYGAARVGSQLFGQLRDAIFVRVSQHAVRAVALTTFRHLHRLSMRFHLDRQTGGLSRVIERGTKAIQFILNFTLFNIAPTLFEIGLVVVILLRNYTPWIALITFGSVALYIVFTITVTEWRTKFRREMNRRDNEAMTKAIDSLLNFETVKYFGNEGHEAEQHAETGPVDAFVQRLDQLALAGEIPAVDPMVGLRNEGDQPTHRDHRWFEGAPELALP
ncbi:MAG: hypothetical protein IIB66_13530, partial [Proteobacteria bacterium]|nr:hypothetical protein [Pseudomonadota bacterium]